jgi:hypothetical protein
MSTCVDTPGGRSGRADSRVHGREADVGEAGWRPETPAQGRQILSRRISAAYKATQISMTPQSGDYSKQFTRRK